MQPIDLTIGAVLPATSITNSAGRAGEGGVSFWLPGQPGILGDFNSSTTGAWPGILLLFIQSGTNFLRI